VLKVLASPVGAYQVNAILVWCYNTHHAALFDPSAESDDLIRRIEGRRLYLDYLINTHGHLDHIAENGAIKSQFDVPLLIHGLDRPMLRDPARNLSLLTGELVVSPDADGELHDGDELRIGDEMVKVLHTPGHTPGSCSFYQTGLLISGDTLFAGGVGRTDLPGGNESLLLESIRTKILTLPDDTLVYPGHGPTTTVGHERRTNPFIHGG
jgi:hydroxyacylglutathione hydrolase